MMLQKQWAAGALLIGALAVAACGAAQPATPAPVETNPVVLATVTSPVSPLPTPGVAESPLGTPGAEVTDLAGLVAALEAGGAAIDMGDTVEQPFFEVQGRQVNVNGESVEVFEWADEASRAAVSQTITPQGQFGTTMVEWVATPHFWASGKIIVLYVGETAEVVDLISAALGPPIAQG